MPGRGPRDACAPSGGEAVDAAIGELIVAERGVSELLQSVRYSLALVEEENRRLKREVAQAHVNWYTERQLAERMGISKDTLARLRKKKLIPFVRITATVIRYSTIQEAEIAEILATETQSRRGGLKAVL
jgi:transcriptional regulator with XRE-family HTH domain